LIIVMAQVPEIKAHVVNLHAENKQPEWQKYDSSENLLKVAFSFRNTVVQMSLQKSEVYVFATFHFLVAFFYRSGYIHVDQQDLLYLPFSLLDIIVGLMTFFICFYQKYCFKRYLAMYDQTRGLLSKLLDLVQELRWRMPAGQYIHDKPALGAKRTVVRYFLASMYLFFFFMNNGSISDKEYEVLVDGHILYSDEVEWLQEYAGAPYSAVLDWAVQLMAIGIKDDKNKEKMGRFVSRMVNEVRHEQTAVQDSIKMPIPFQYFHMMSLMLSVNFILWSYGMALYASWIASVIYCFSLLIFFGMKELSAALSDPFGDDEVDFPLNIWIEEQWADCHFFLEADVKEIVEQPGNFNHAPLLWDGNSAVDVFADAEGTDDDEEDDGVGKTSRFGRVRQLWAGRLPEMADTIPYQPLLEMNRAATTATRAIIPTVVSSKAEAIEASFLPRVNSQRAVGGSAVAGEEGRRDDEPQQESSDSD